MMDPTNPKRGDRFEHARFITGSPKAGTAKPVVCTVTRVTSLTVWYDGFYADRESFPNVVGKAL